jgi:hypothetical protein
VRKRRYSKRRIIGYFIREKVILYDEIGKITNIMRFFSKKDVT